MSRRRKSEERDWFPEGSRPSRRDSLNGAREFKQEFRPGDWECDSCQAHNFARRDSCFKCDRGRSGRRSRSPIGRARRRSPIYRDYRDQPSYTYKEGDWQCPKCRFDNYARRTRCFKCDRMRSGGGSSRNASNYREGDWFCRGCGKDNFASRTECFRCGERK